MYPNPQEALPLPAHPSLEQYRKLAEDLVRACRADDPNAIRAWALEWIEAIVQLTDEAEALRARGEIEDHVRRVDEFARKQLSGGDESSRACALADAQFVIARAHGFLDWPRCAAYLESLAIATSTESAFEAAASAIVAGDLPTLTRLLHEHPQLARVQSAREHRATLLHYTSANGVEGYRQRSPTNIAEIARMLLAAGAEVDAEADVYEGRCTPLGLVATSAPPSRAGVQQAVIEVLLDHGARVDRPGIAGRDVGLIYACLANGQPEAAAYLASRGAAVDFVSAGGLGRIDVLTEHFDQRGHPKAPITSTAMKAALSMACAYGQADAAEFLLDRGLSVDDLLGLHGEGHTGLHVASYHAHTDTVRALLARGARVDITDQTWGTPPLVWALTGWEHKPRVDSRRYYDVVRQLVAAGATVTPGVLEWDKARADPQMLAALSGGAETHGAEP